MWAGLVFDGQHDYSNHGIDKAIWEIRQPVLSGRGRCGSRLVQLKS